MQKFLMTSSVNETSSISHLIICNCYKVNITLTEFPTHLEHKHEIY